MDHFRPKGGAERSVGVRDDAHYWWLAWSWENLLFSCQSCNTGHKGDHFPLVPGTAALPLPDAVSLLDPQAPCWQTSEERPLLLDPADPHDHPLNHLRWRPEDASKPWTTWRRWSLEGTTDRGRETVRLLDLRRLTDDVNDHWTVNVQPQLATSASDPDHWRETTHRLTSAAIATHPGATWLMIREVRQQAGLDPKTYPPPPLP